MQIQKVHCETDTETFEAAFNAWLKHHTKFVDGCPPHVRETLLTLFKSAMFAGVSWAVSVPPQVSVRNFERILHSIEEESITE